MQFTAVKHVHSCGILHCDIKPSNFVFGTGRNAGRIYLIDFNLWTTYRNFHTHEHLPSNCASRGYRGTCHFASINCQLELRKCFTVPTSTPCRADILICTCSPIPEG